MISTALYSVGCAVIGVALYLLVVEARQSKEDKENQE